jgi:hypothetical protein
VTTYSIIEQDRIDAENFLEQFLTDSVPNADFRKGGALRDFAVGALASIFAYMKKEVDYVKARQSLLLLGTLTGSDVDSAVDEILSNWFISRLDGTYARGMVTLYFTQVTSTGASVPYNAKFTQSTGLVFNVDSVSDINIAAADMLPVYDTSGIAVAYAAQIPLIADQIGSAYNIPAGAFSDFSRFNFYLSRVENAQAFAGGGDKEATADMLTRAETAISTRNMISARSIDVVLKNEFPEINNLVTVGYGDPEMLRDLVEEESTRTRIHSGGHADVYLHSDILTGQVANLEVGGLFADPRPGYYVLRDDQIDFEVAGVLRGDIIRIYNALTDEQDEYVVSSVLGGMCLISRRSQFPREIPDPINSSTYTDGQTIAPATFAGNTGYTFLATDVGRFIRIKNSATATNNQIWQIGAVIALNRVTLLNMVVPLVAETPVQWDLIEREIVGEFTNGAVGPIVGPHDALYGLSDYTFVATDVGRWIEVTGATNPVNNGIRQIAVVNMGLNLVELAVPVVTFIAETNIHWKMYETDPVYAQPRVTHTVVAYTIGDNSPAFDNKVHAHPAGLPVVIVPSIRGRFTKEIQVSGQVLLPQIPIYQITDVSFADGAHPLQVDGRVTFGIRSNNAPIDPGVDPNKLEYQVVCLNPAESQSGWQLMQLVVNNPGYNFDGETLRVTYDTPTGYSSVWSYMLASDRRIVCAGVIPKGLHPVYVNAVIRYTLANTALVALDETVAIAALVEYLNNFPVSEDLYTSDIVAFLQNTYEQIGGITLPITITYELIAPDGRLIYYTTDDKVIVDPSKHLYPSDLLKCLGDPIAAGVSHNTIRYVSTISRITLINIS